MIRIAVEADQAGMRLDRLLRKRLPLTSLSEIYRLMRKGSIRVGGKRRRENYRVQEGDVVEAALPQAELSQPSRSTSEALRGLSATHYFQKNFRPIFEDDEILVCNKPAGLVVHPGTGHQEHDTLVDLAVAHLLRQANGTPIGEPALVHRLDRDTSGVILIAKNKRLLRTLHVALRERTVQKEYVAICHGRPPKQHDTVRVALSRTHERHSGTKMKVGDEGQAAAITYRLLDSGPQLSRVAVDLHTGRTHQIRVMMAHLGCPLVGDVRYGNEELDARVLGIPGVLRRLYLHAACISFYYPSLNRTVRFEAPLPSEFEDLMRAVSQKVAL